MQTEEDDWIGGLTWGEEGAGESGFLEESESSDLLELKQLKMHIYQHRSTEAQRKVTSFGGN